MRQSELEQRGRPWMEYHVKVFTPDTATAKRLAYCVKVTEVVEELALAEDSVRHPHPVAINILNEAAQQEDK